MNHDQGVIRVLEVGHFPSDEVGKLRSSRPYRCLGIDFFFSLYWCEGELVADEDSFPRFQLQRCNLVREVGSTHSS